MWQVSLFEDAILKVESIQFFQNWIINFYGEKPWTKKANRWRRVAFIPYLPGWNSKVSVLYQQNAFKDVTALFFYKENNAKKVFPNQFCVLENDYRELW